ncbi:hypothetical protein HMF8227_01118 [Saliniradius amylolyticus]|uniref:DUF3429 domain-containing protein n=1 Tax=Saliniradius amylolyticus TaxID=2183582 RepID=A0A2S2E1X7_9ALTE|nr:DUF3429 domain-containing protein [Saliniradius amylolyticus]AWL11599.1 hypothetical protein HMF8227_01118 [Saliniradius amylolyticus]
MYLLLGWAGILPFVILSAGSVFGWLPPTLATQWFSLYSLVILSFMAGTQWGWAVKHQHAPTPHLLSVTPVVLAFLLAAIGDLVIISTPVELAILSGLFVWLWIYDRLLFREHSHYLKLRLHLTTVVVACHIMMIWQAQ